MKELGSSSHKHPLKVARVVKAQSVVALQWTLREPLEEASEWLRRLLSNNKELPSSEKAGESLTFLLTGQAVSTYFKARTGS